MLRNEALEILNASRKTGWVLEPEAKRLLFLEGFQIPKFTWARNREDAMIFARGLGGYPVVAKVVSPRIIHKSDVGGVATDIANDAQLGAAFSRFSRMDGFEGVIVEERVTGVELIVGATFDYQFGPVILLGFGGTSVEIYKDTALRLAPLGPKDALSMVKQLKAHPLLEGYRGSEPVNMEELVALLTGFSRLILDMEELVESVDLNPVVCARDRCIIADARIMLPKS
jgi:acyl-CoA synthetase (NDP forming)